MECKRCGNKDPSLFYKGSKGLYCRNCIGFSRILLDEDLKEADYYVDIDASNYSFKYELTEKQKVASRKCLDGLKTGDILLYCVCGAGKTELTVESISDYLSRGLKVAYAISRREVVIELCERFKRIFNQAKVIGVYGGHHDDLYGDLIVCTTHQLYRYYKTFDLLVLDEVDAFPLKGNETLMNISINSCKGRIIFSTATIDNELNRILDNRKYSKVELYTRPSNKPLIIPTIIYMNKYISIICLYVILVWMTKQCIIFVPSKKMCKTLYTIFSRIISCTYVYSDLDNRNKNIIDFKNKKYKYIFATTVLERGITIKGVNVVILNYDNVFDQSNLIQMLGRVGRDINNPTGDAYIFSNYNKNVSSTIAYLKEANSYI